MLRVVAAALTGIVLLTAPAAGALRGGSQPPRPVPSAAASLEARGADTAGFGRVGGASSAEAPGTPTRGVDGVGPGGGAGGGGAATVVPTDSVVPEKWPAPPAARWAWPLTPRPRVARLFDAPPQPWLAGHRGVDLAAPAGAEVRAPADGVVAFRGTVASRPVLSIDHAGGLRSTYEPVTSALIAGTVVSRGQVIGTLATGHDCPAASCLHWGVRRGEAYLDPLSLVGGIAPVLLPLR